MVFISSQKLFPFSRYLSFCLDILVMYQSNLIQKIMLVLNFMTSQPGQQTILIRILPNISGSKRIYQLLKAIRQWHLVS